MTSLVVGYLSEMLLLSAEVVSIKGGDKNKELDQKELYAAVRVIERQTSRQTSVEI